MKPSELHVPPNQGCYLESEIDTEDRFQVAEWGGQQRRRRVREEKVLETARRKKQLPSRKGECEACSLQHPGERALPGLREKVGQCGAQRY